MHVELFRKYFLFATETPKIRVSTACSPSTSCTQKHGGGQKQCLPVPLQQEGTMCGGEDTTTVSIIRDTTVHSTLIALRERSHTLSGSGVGGVYDNNLGNNLTHTLDEGGVRKAGVGSLRV